MNVRAVKPVDTKVSDETIFDAIIIGGGPAGSYCALWLKMLSYKSCIIDKRDSLGGLQNESPYPNQWIAVLPGLTGQQVAVSMHDHIKSHNIPLHLNSTVTGVQPIDDGYRVHFKDNQGSTCALFAKNLVLASGVKPTSGGLDPSDNLLVGPGKQIHNYNFKTKRVAILGGGDSAFENYEFIQKKHPELVHIYARHDNDHGIKARNEFLKRVPGKDVYCYQGKLAIDSEKFIINGINYDVFIALYGWTANLPELAFRLELNEKGFVKTDPDTFETSQQNVYAIGELAQRSHPCCVTAMADGVKAAKAIERKSENLLKHSFFANFNSITNDPDVNKSLRKTT